MKILQLAGNLPAELAPGYRRFEEESVYPLGGGRSFRVQHPAGSHAFFAAMGPALHVLGIDDQGIFASGAVALRTLHLPCGTTSRCAYFGDLRVSLRARGSLALHRALRALETWVGERADLGVGIVMEGTALTPSDYTGRVGLPAFYPVRHLDLWLLSGDPPTPPTLGVRQTTWLALESELLRLAPGVVRPEVLLGQGRSEMAQQPLVTDPPGSCGILEDTRTVKRLILDDGKELRAGHLSCFAFNEPEAGASLLAHATRRARTAGLDSVFVSLTPEQAAQLQAQPVPGKILTTRAIVYSTSNVASCPWQWSSAEI